MYVYMCVSVWPACMVVHHVYEVLKESSGGRWLPWEWSYRWL